MIHSCYVEVYNMEDYFEICQIQYTVDCGLCQLLCTYVLHVGNFQDVVFYWAGGSCGTARMHLEVTKQKEKK